MRMSKDVFSSDTFNLSVPFNVRPGDKLYLPPQQRVQIW